nr:hypothetical protein [Tanacetum cinerariifolium]
MQFFKPSRSIIHFPSRLIDDSYEEKEVQGELINEKESARNLKRLLKKRPMKGYQIEASINVHDSAILDDALRRKEKDPGSFTVPCNINNICFEKDLANLGVSVSVMPYMTFTNLVFKSDNPTSNIIKKVYVLGLRERMELDLEARLISEGLILNRSLDPKYGDYTELNEPWELMRNQEVDDLGPIFKEKEVIDGPMIDIIKTWDDDEMIEGIDEYPSFYDFNRRIPIDCAYNLQFSCMIVVKNMDAY